MRGFTAVEKQKIDQKYVTVTLMPPNTRSTDLVKKKKSKQGELDTRTIEHRGQNCCWGELGSGHCLLILSVIVS